ncbi:TIGR00730 family Rossman fold protein [Pistricoccus aurantiacus]|uniref:Cytokinin riboside 5'-monophosphate phosphoribohydrolase n=1 Tax=Pistricoccus aurantiacus TaxID=1883414 RepID=A0A5B8SVU1_9GAMM|nr:TIGR00730 family Rossman fold protein [Pistricoccus aurantiacus]QEA38860.1 TIGR00730 family Rossman fold protein [Pistricoccus aurantiacus]
MATICVYLGSREGKVSAFRQAAEALGLAMTQRGHTLVYGGARVGLMGALADSVMQAGGRAIGIIPHQLVEREQAHLGLHELIRVANMHERKSLMEKHADAFIALPGGIGTLEELFETWTWQYLGLHDKPIGVLDSQGFYTPLLSFLDQVVEQGFLDAPTRRELIAAPSPEALLDAIEARLSTK